MQTSVVTFDKPLPHLTFDEWKSKLADLQKTAEDKLTHAFQLRHSTRELRNETNVKTRWDTYFSDTQLNERIYEVSRWCSRSEDLLTQVDRELFSLKDERAATERELEGLSNFIYVTSECISNRDARKSTELTSDHANIELKKELCVEEMNKKLLAEYIKVAWENVNLLEKLKFQLLLEINDKKETIAIDKDQLTLNNNCANITYKPDATRKPTGSVIDEVWMENQKKFQSEGERQLRAALGAREQLFIARERARNNMRAQIDATDHELRVRIHGTKRAHTELSYQKDKMEGNMNKLVAEIATLTASLRAKSNALKLAETRLENRCLRPVPDLSLDAPDQSLKNEVANLKETMKILNDRLNFAKATLNDLEATSLFIYNDLLDKTNTLEIDIRALEMRDAAKGDPNDTQADRSINLVFSGRIPNE